MFHCTREMGVGSRSGETLRDDDDKIFQSFQPCFEKGPKLNHNSVCADDVLPGQRLFRGEKKSCSYTSFQWSPLSPRIATKLAALGVRQSSHGVRILNFQQGIVEVKTGQSSIRLNRGGHIQLVDLQNGICTCQKLQLFYYYCLHMLAACRTCIVTQTNARRCGTPLYAHVPTFWPIPNQLTGHLTQAFFWYWTPG